MGIPPLLAWKCGYGGTAVQAVRILNGTTIDATQLGDVTGFTGAVWDATHGPQPTNRIVEFRGNIFAFHAGTAKIYRFDFDVGTNGTWTEVDTLPNGPGTTDDQRIAGFEIVDVGGELRLYLLYNQFVSSTARARWTSDGITWNSAATVGSLSAGFISRTLVYKGKIYITSPAGSVDVFDPLADAWSEVTTLGFAMSGRPNLLINFKGRLLWIGSSSTNSVREIMRFKELVAGGFNDVDISNTGGSTYTTLYGSSIGGNTFAFEDNDKLYVVFDEKTNATNGDGPGQVRCFEFTPDGSSPGDSWTENDITSTVVPSDWLTGGAFANLFNPRSGYSGYVDTSNPESPQIFWWRMADLNETENSTFWTWNGSSSLMTVEDSDVNRTVQPASGTNASGEHVYTEGDFNVTLENPVIRPGVVDFDFTIEEPIDGSTVTPKSGRLYYTIGGSNWIPATISTDSEDAPTFANPTLAGTDPAPTVATDTTGTILQNIPIGHKFTATWDSTADGFTVAGSRFELMLEIF